MFDGSADMGTTAVQVEDLRKRYGDVQALEGLSFEVRPDEIFGLVGPNGAGKTTTLRTLATLLNRDSGTVTVAGHDVDDEPDAVRRAIRYLPEDAGAYESMSGRQFLEFVADFYADGEEATRMVERGVEIADLGDRIDDDTGAYSKGMTRKLLLGSALMTRPRLAILDEPTSGLDVQNSKTVREVVKAFPDDERSILLSSHDMLEVEYLCDRVGLLNDGVVVTTGSPAELKAEYDAQNLEDVFLEVVA
ncbi:ABC transporter ATP-binding protein [Halosimplex halophilum]|uniref:ABC transporter ATP-binding protein n=1 Tax=Halosimplex halophilum TaxID=2559572 RepID=UPI001FE8AAC6|nr:ABC transporter ATP-binding protein [Halosimplex halophilum]